jgi:PAS domain S-box-containing protein
VSKDHRARAIHESSESDQVGDESSINERQSDAGVGGEFAEPDRRLEDDVRDLLEGFLTKDTGGRLRNVKMLALLAQAIDKIDYSVLILDLNFHIVYANDSAARTSGYLLKEIVGADPRIFGSGWHSVEFYDKYVRTVQAGLPWHGVFINRRKSGAIYQEETTISPIFDETDAIIAYVEAKYELTGSRHFEKELTLARTDQEAIAQIMHEVLPTNNLRETAKSFCDAVVRLADIDVAIVLHPFGGSKMRTIAASGTTVYDPTKASPFVGQVASSVLEQVAAGPVQIPLTRSEWLGVEQFQQRLVEDGAAWIVAVPIRFGDKMIGALILASRDPATEMSVDSRLSFFGQLGSFAGAIIGYRSMEFERDEDLYAVVKDVISLGRFTIVFQPIVDLAAYQPVGYEALTRFDDGVTPAERFADAHIVGLGRELECATAAAALRAAESLPEEAFLDLNFSADAILDGSAAKVVRGTKRQVVIEITEHEMEGDFTALRHAIMQMENCHLAIDDMGAGYTSLSQLIELRPKFVKLDISMIRDIDKNPIRQSMVDAICHFAVQTGVVVIAEGVETEAEAEMIRSLGSAMDSGHLLAQGYLFGHPEELPEVKVDPLEGDEGANR